MHVGAGWMAAAVAMVALSGQTAPAAQEEPAAGVVFVLARADGSGTPVRLVTDRNGEAKPQGLTPGGYWIEIPDRAALGSTIRIRFAAGNNRGKMVSEPIEPGRGSAFATDAAGKKLVIDLPDGSSNGLMGNTIQVTKLSKNTRA